MTSRFARCALLATVLVAGMGTPPASGARGGKSGLSTEFGDVRLPCLAIGKTYSTSRLAESPLVIRNTGDDTMRVHVAVVIPARHELRPGALPVPDPHWVEFDSTDFVLPPHTTACTDVRLTLPYDPDLAGHTYQAVLWSGDAGRQPRDSGQRHTLLFTVDMDYRDDTEADFACRAAVWIGTR